MRTTLTLSMFISLITIGCGGSQHEPVETLPTTQESIPFQVTKFWQSECKPQLYSLDQEPATGETIGVETIEGEIIEVEQLGETVKISHIDAEYNCAARVKMTASLVGSQILVQEIIENPEEQVFCVCDYDLSVEVQGLAPGVYTVEVTDGNGQVVGQTQVTVGESPQVSISETIQSDCKAASDGPDASDGGGVSAIQDGDTLKITHQDAEYNCAARLKMEATLVGDEILVQEILLNPGEEADCICPFDISVDVAGLADGSYTVKVFSIGGLLVGEVQVTIGSLSSLSYDSTLQSDCKDDMNSSSNGPAQGTIKATVVGQNAAIITHEDASYNCAAKLLLEASLSGTEIIVTETIENPQVQANCICNFDLSVTVRGLASGTYTVKVYDALMQLAGETLLTIS